MYILWLQSPKEEEISHSEAGESHLSGEIMTSFRTLCKKCGHEFEYQPFRKNSKIPELETSPRPQCPECEDYLQTIILEKLVRRNET